jgi:Domain of unknown function (DUF4349)
MKRTVLARRGALTGAVLISGCLLVTACGSSNSNSASSAPALRAAGHGAPATGALPAAAGFGAAAAPASVGSQGKAAVQTAKLAPADQSIIYTASLTVRATNVTAAANRAVSIVAAAGGYTADEQRTSAKSEPSGRTVSLTLKVPVAAYQQVLGQLSSPALGKQLSMQQQATDVTQQVADVNSLVTSEQAAIAALQGLLKRAAGVSGLLQVQQQISDDESTLNSLLAQQRALDHETTYGTVTMTLVSPRHVAPHKTKPAPRHTFVTGLAAGWRALRHATAVVLTALGAALPFLIVVAVLGGIGYAGRRRFARRRPGPAVAGPTAAGPTTAD